MAWQLSLSLPRPAELHLLFQRLQLRVHILLRTDLP
jgi:hypothetical protein